MEIIPAIDIIEGKCVRLSKGDYDSKKIYNEDPLEVARMFESWGFKRLHLVDLDGAKARHIVNRAVLENIASKTSLVIDFGGGIKTDEDLREAFDSGAQMITGGSIALRDPERFLSWLEEYGSRRIILGADHRGGKISVTGWTRDSSTDLFAFIGNYFEKGIRKTVCTDIDRDGMLSGPSKETYAAILDRFPGIYLIASGGISSVKDLEELEDTGLPAAIVGKAIYEGRITEGEIRKFLNE